MGLCVVHNGLFDVRVSDQMTKPITRVCIDCGARVKNRRRATRRCAACHLTFITATATGRSLPNCRGCGKRLTIKKNLTGLCFECLKSIPRVKRGPTGKPAWNSGTSKYESPSHAANAARERRKALRGAQGPEHHEFLADRIRTLIRNGLRRTSSRKAAKTTALIGCTIAQFRQHLELQFMPGMSWANYGNGAGKWSIDHIRPLSRFDLRDPDQQRAAFHYLNCRPLWSEWNSRKGNKLEWAPPATLAVTFGYQKP